MLHLSSDRRLGLIQYIFCAVLAMGIDAYIHCWLYVVCQVHTFFMGSAASEKYYLLHGIVYLNVYSYFRELKRYNLPGVLPTQLVKLPRLQVV
jgi:hypothetical protein